jgi:catechol 2,3-dioxygenase-like lactoylglutathione lyase family enzyme
MDKNYQFLGTIPILPSSDIDRDIAWYKEKAGFEVVHANDMYAVLQRDTIYLHLQWHAGTEDDPLGGSAIRIVVKNITRCLKSLYKEARCTNQNL